MFNVRGGRPKVNVHREELRAKMQIECGKFVVRQAALVAAVARQEVGVETGALRRSIKIGPPIVLSALRVGAKVSAQAGSGERSRRAIWHHEGTGVYGARHKPITPVRAPRLVFRWAKMGNILMVVKSVKGQVPNPYLVHALNKVLVVRGWRIRYRRS